MMLQTPELGACQLNVPSDRALLMPTEVLANLGVVATTPPGNGLGEDMVATPSEVLAERMDPPTDTAQAVFRTFRDRMIDAFRSAGCSVGGRVARLNNIQRTPINQLAREWQQNPRGVPMDFDDPRLPSPLLDVLDMVSDDSLYKVGERLRTVRLFGNRGTLGGDRTVDGLCALVGLKIVDPTTLPNFGSATLDRLDKLAFRYARAKD